MKKDSFEENSNFKWMESLVVLIIIATLIFANLLAGKRYESIADEKVALWSGNMTDELEELDKEMNWEE